MDRDPSVSGTDLTQLDVSTLQAMRREGALSAVDLVLTLVDRIEASGINAVRTVNPDALLMAAASDARMAAGRLLSPIDGMPVLVKDNIDTKDKMPTTAGSAAMAGCLAGRDATLVGRIRRSGAVLLGKANLTEWANFMAHGMPNGYSSLGGQVLNPYGPGRLDVGGSSSGSGAAVAAGLAVMAVGTETSGSILSPSSANGLVGVKPTVGLISRRGIAPISWSQDTAGPMARTVRDAALLLQVLAGADRADAATWPRPPREDYAAALNADALVGARLGVPRQGYWERLAPPRRAVAERALEQVRGLGADVVEVDLPTWRDLPGLEVLLYEAKPALNAYLADRPEAPVRSVAELIRWNRSHADRALRYGQAILLAVEGTRGDLTERAYWTARRDDLRLSRTEGIDRALKDHALDAILFVNNVGAGIAAKAGYPSVTVPAGLTESGEPVGLTFTASAWQEAKLLGLAYGFEQGAHARVAPPVAV
jgi:amidase